MEKEEIKAIEKKKRWLKKYKKNVKKLERLEDKLEELNARLEGVGSPRFSDMPKGGGPGVTSLDLLADKEELENRIARQKQHNREIKAAILEELDRLDDTRHIEVLEMFFIDCMTPEDIAADLCYNVRTVYRLYAEGVKLLTFK